MPEIRFRLRWPDGRQQTFYSPSLVIKDYFEEGQAYLVDEFLIRSREALHVASERVKAKYGFACSRAASALADIEASAAPFKHMELAHVAVEAFEI